MSHLVASVAPQAGAHTVKAYAGFGILGADIPASGDTAGSPVLNDGISSTAEYYWRVETLPDAGTLTIYPDLSYLLVGASDGVHPWVYRLFENGIDQGTATVTERIGVFPHLVGIAGSQQVNTAAAVAIKQTHKIGIASSHQAIAAAAIAIRQTHKIGVANSQQTATASAGSVSQSATVFVAAANSQQVNQASPVGIRQTHRIGIANSVQLNTCSPVSVLPISGSFSGSLSDADIDRIAAAVWAYANRVITGPTAEQNADALLSRTWP